jgi:DNA-binding MarR family transcriptional regulator
MGAVHRFDGGRTVPLIHAAKVNTPQLGVLELTRSPRMVSEVASWLGPSRPATSQLIDKLVRRGLLRRYEGAADRRERNVVLTPNWTTLLNRITDARAARFDAALAALSAPLAPRLAKVLREVVTALDAGSEPPPAWQAPRPRPSQWRFS